MYLNGLKKIFI